MKLACPECGKTKIVEPDSLDPPNAYRMVIICPDCDDGDRHAPEYFDAKGNWIDPSATENLSNRLV
jgi:hypothetical protein